MTNFEGSNFENLDPSDFGEPTPETRARLDSAIESLKQLGSGITYEVDLFVGDVDTVSDFGISTDELCPVTQYSYDQSNDPLFDIDEETFIKYDLLDGDPEKFKNWQRVVGERTFTAIYYQNTEVDINYHRSFESEELYITTPLDNSIDKHSEEYMRMIIEKMKVYIQAIKNGAAIPTEGSMKKLVDFIEHEVAKRVVE